MEIFVGHQLEKFASSLGCGEPPSAELEHGAMVVFQPSIPLVEKVKDEQIGVPWRAFLPHQAATGQAHLLHMPQPGWIGCRIPPQLTQRWGTSATAKECS